MDDRKLQVFLKAVHTGSFSQASEELNCTQSAVTQSINALETELGSKLLQRSYNGVQLTPEGKRLLPIVAEAEAALTRLKTAAAQRITSIRLGSFSSTANTWLPTGVENIGNNLPNLCKRWNREGLFSIVLISGDMFSTFASSIRQSIECFLLA